MSRREDHQEIERRAEQEFLALAMQFEEEELDSERFLRAEERLIETLSRECESEWDHATLQEVDLYEDLYAPEEELFL